MPLHNTIAKMFGKGPSSVMNVYIPHSMYKVYTNRNNPWIACANHKFAFFRMGSHRVMIYHCSTHNIVCNNPHQKQKIMNIVVVPSCLKNFLAVFSVRVFLLLMNLDKSPPPQYSMMRKIYSSSH